MGGGCQLKLGNSFEEAVDASFLRYMGAGLAYGMRIPTPYKQVGGFNSFRFRGVRCAKQGADFLGCLRGGRAVVIECKHTKARRRWGYNGLAEAQVRALVDVARLGGVAAVVLWCEPRERALWLPVCPPPGIPSLPAGWLERGLDLGVQNASFLRAQRAAAGVEERPASLVVDEALEAGLGVPVTPRAGLDWLAVVERLEPGGAGVAAAGLGKGA